ncbi:MAG: hypothetical protein PHP44_00235 [Kiritimatiellae bacterium]|nr:hypothetical protein [Kiritimatiellia bacterium]
MTFFRHLYLTRMISVVCLLAACAAAYGLDEQACFDKLTTHFSPSKPTVVMTYNVTYRLLGIHMLSVATATMEATEGYWTYPESRRTEPCCLISIRLQSTRCDEETKKNGRIYINDHLVSVSTMPGLNTILYMKKTDEYINPPFKKAKRIEHTAVYDLENGSLDYYAQNYLTGEIQTNLTGAADMATQGKEVSKVLQMVSDVYHGRRDLITPESDFRLMINCDGLAVPFAAQTSRENLSILGKAWPTLCAEVMPAREAPKIKSRDFSMWATSFEEMASQLDDPVLKQLAKETPAWGMTPLLANYGLALGYIRCAITDIHTIAHLPDETAILSRSVAIDSPPNEKLPLSNHPL